MSQSLVSRAGAVARMFRRVCRKRGFVRAMWLGVHELFFDLWNGTRTSLDIPNGSVASPKNYEGHEGSNPLLFEELLRTVSLERGRSVFLDYGAGKGRALLLAAQHGFKKAIGVELSAALCATALRNSSTYRKRHPWSSIEVHCADAATFEVPDEVNVAYFFNPFGPEVMLAAIDRIIESLRRSPREFHVIYLNPRYGELFIRKGFIPVYRQGTEGLILCC